MDNASKALVMAGAILISIALVGVGVYIFSSTSSIMNSGQQQIDAAAAQMANSTLRQYSGNRQRGSSVKEFIEYCEVLNTNQTYPVNILPVGESQTDHGLTGTSTGKSSIVANAYYTVELADGNGDGYYDTYKVSASSN